MKKQAARKGIWIGSTLVSLNVASDGKWDWTSNYGDRHTDFASIALVERPSEPVVLRMNVGPFMVLFARRRRR